MELHSESLISNSSNCRYFSINDQIGLPSSSLNIIHLNVRSANSNLDEFFLLLSEMKLSFHIIILTETWLRSTDEWIDIPGYHAYHNIRSNRKGGGVSILVSNSIASNAVPNLTLSNDIFENVGITLKINNILIYIIGTYRIPSSSINDFNSAYFQLINSIPNSSLAVIGGDFNIDSLNDTSASASNDFFNSLSSISFSQQINIPTRISSTSSTCIDHIFINSYTECLSGVIDYNVSDHFPIFCSIPQIFKKDNAQYSLTVRDLSQKSLDNFSINLKNRLESFHIFDNFSIDHKFEILENLLTEVYNDNCPIKIKNIPKKRITHPWISHSLSRCINEKHRLRKISK